MKIKRTNLQTHGWEARENNPRYPREKYICIFIKSVKNSYRANNVGAVFLCKPKKRTKKKNELDEGEIFSLQVIFDLWNSTVKSLAKVHGKKRKRAASASPAQPPRRSPRFAGSD